MLYLGAFSQCFVALGCGSLSLGRVTFSLNPWVYSLKKLIRLSKGKEIIRGRASSRGALGKVSLSSSQGEEVASRSRGGLGISKDIMPVIMHKEGSGRIVIR